MCNIRTVFYVYIYGRAKRGVFMEDAAIIELYFARDQLAISETDTKYGAMCHTIAQRILHSAPDAEECVNDAYLHTWNAIPPKRPTSLAAFVGSLTRNISIDRYRRSTAAKRTASFTPLDELAECLPDPNSAPSDSIAENELAQLISSFLDTLPQAQRVYFMRRYWLGEPVAEIAKRYGVSPNTLGVTLHRIRAKLKKALQNSDLWQV